MDEMKKVFDTICNEKKGSLTDKGTIILSQSEYDKICASLKGWEELAAQERSARNKAVGGNRAYKWAQKYVVHASTTAEGEEDLQLLSKRDMAPNVPAGADVAAQDQASTDPLAMDLWVRVVHEGNLFKLLYELHVEGGHMKGRTFEKKIKDKFCRVPRWAHEAIVKCCATCIGRKPRPQFTAGHTPIISRGFGSRGQVDLIDLQSMPDGEYKFLLNYQDHALKWYDNRPLTSKRAAAVAFALLDIFSVIGPPCLLQADNGREFSNIAGGGGRKGVDKNGNDDDDDDHDSEEGRAKVGRGRAKGKGRAQSTKRRRDDHDGDDEGERVMKRCPISEEEV